MIETRWTTQTLETTPEIALALLPYAIEWDAYGQNRPLKSFISQPSREEKEEVISETPQSPTTLMPVEQSQNQQQNEVMEIPAGGNL